MICVNACLYKTYMYMFVSLDTRAERRHPYSWLLLSWWGRWRWYHYQCMVWARGHGIPPSPRSSTELPGTGDQNWNVYYGPIWHQRLVMWVWFIDCKEFLYIHIRWLEVNTFGCIPQRIPRSSTLISHSSFTTLVRWDWHSIKILPAHALYAVA